MYSKIFTSGNADIYIHVLSEHATFPWPADVFATDFLNFTLVHKCVGSGSRRQILICLLITKNLDVGKWTRDTKRTHPPPRKPGYTIGLGGVAFVHLAAKQQPGGRCFFVELRRPPSGAVAAAACGWFPNALFC